MKLFETISMIFLSGAVEAIDVDPTVKLQRILNKFTVVSDFTVRKTRSNYARMDIKQRRVHRMGGKMLKYYEQVKGKCIFSELEEDEQDVRSEDACFAFKKVSKRILNWSKAFNPDCDAIGKTGQNSWNEAKLLRITKPMLRILQCEDRDLKKNRKPASMRAEKN